jgi:toxin ParE1/3/4
MDYLEEEAGLETAELFLDQLIASFEALSLRPRMGALCGFHKSRTRRLRRWRVKNFENWLIFYQAKRNGVEIIHIMHGARDIESLLGEQTMRDRVLFTAKRRGYGLPVATTEGSSAALALPGPVSTASHAAD